VSDVQRDIADLACALAAWGSRASGKLTAADWQEAGNALAALDRLTATLGHVRAGLVREMEREGAPGGCPPAPSDPASGAQRIGAGQPPHVKPRATNGTTAGKENDHDS